ncbi:MAG: pantoate--beta-alanine ligase [Clostridium sp.]
MDTTTTINTIRNKVKAWHKKGLSVGFVPTMGYLHEGHMSLIEKASKENDKVIVSIFVNPTQFGPNEDLENYPRDLNKDIQTCEKSGADLLFLPEVSEMYFEDKATSVSVSGLTKLLCGEKRPCHFNGVCLVLTKLFNIVNPDKAYFGEKDAQQLAVIKRFVRDLNFDIEIIGCPIVRECDGLAKSSRNTYLSIEERKAALILSKSLNKAREFLKNGETSSDSIKNIIIESISTESLAKIDYVEVVDSLSLERVGSTIKAPILVAIAVYIGTTRLIDNFTY